MVLCKWDDLPDSMRTEEVRKYYDILDKKRFSLVCKRAFDIVFSLLLLIILSPAFLILAAAIKIDSPGPVFFRQVRITQYGRCFKIHKFRSMFVDADKKGTLVTVNGDKRITRVGSFIRKYRLDEFAQVIDVLEGTMTFVSVRPEVPQYVAKYTSEMMATLLLPAGVTNLTSLYYSEESELLSENDNPDKTYIEKILPEKMKWNLKGIEEYSFFRDIMIMFLTALVIVGVKFKH